MKILFLIILLLFSFNVIAKSKGSVTGLELPRFVSLKSDESNLRNGPSKNYPIKLTYKVKNKQHNLIGSRTRSGGEQPLIDR